MHILIKVLVKLCRALGLPDWAALVVIVPILLAGGVMAVLVRRKYFQVLRRKLKPYHGTLRYGLLFWRPTAHFEVDGIPGRMPWCSYFRHMTRIQFDRVGAAGRMIVDSRPISNGERGRFRGEDLVVDDRVFSNRFHAIAAPASFGSALLDPETRQQLSGLLLMSRELLGRGEESTPKGRCRLAIDGKTMTLEVQGLLGTPEAGRFLDEAATLVRRVREISDPAHRGGA
jgi:hypothetical protein